MSTCARALTLFLAISSFGCTAIADLGRFEFVEVDAGPAEVDAGSDDAGLDASVPMDASDMDAAVLDAAVLDAMVDAAAPGDASSRDGSVSDGGSDGSEGGDAS